MRGTKGIILLLNFAWSYREELHVGQFSHLRRFIQQHQLAALQRELVASCSRRISLSVRSALPSALEAAEGFFFASIISTFFWSLLIFAIASW